MKIFLVGSKHNFDKMPAVREGLEVAGHEVTLPAFFYERDKEVHADNENEKAFVEFMSQAFKEQNERVAANDAILVMNFEKNGMPNYIGGSTFLEVYKAWELGKKIYFFNDLPEGIFHDELRGMNPLVINGDLGLISD